MAQSSNVQLKQNSEYQAVLKLNGLMAFAPNDAVVSRFTELGFRKVQVSGSGATRTARGVWNKPDMEVELPEQVVSVSEAKQIKSLF